MRSVRTQMKLRFTFSCAINFTEISGANKSLLSERNIPVRTVTVHNYSRAIINASFMQHEISSAHILSVQRTENARTRACARAQKMCRIARPRCVCRCRVRPVFRAAARKGHGVKGVTRDNRRDLLSSFGAYLATGAPHAAAPPVPT